MNNRRIVVLHNAPNAIAWHSHDLALVYLLKLQCNGAKEQSDNRIGCDLCQRAPQAPFCDFI